MNRKISKPVLIYDESCPICLKAAQWTERNSEEDTFEMVPCQSETLRARFRFVEEPSCMKAMQLILTDGQVLSGAKALPEIIGRLRRYRWAAMLFRLPGAGKLSHVFYHWFAKRRYKISRVLFPVKKDAARRK